LDDERLEFDLEVVSASEPLAGRTKAVSVQRSSSSLSDEDVNAARKIRKGALKDGIDLSAIARTSAAVTTPTSDSVNPLPV